MRRGFYIAICALGLVSGSIVAGILSANSRPVQESPEPAISCGSSDLECLRIFYEDEIKAGRAQDLVSGLLTNAPEARGCHESAHVVGRLVGYYQPGGALGLNSTQLDSRCDYGYMHGVFQGLAEAGVDPVVAAGTYCSTETGVVQRDECFHAAGHGAAVVAKTLQDALDLCSSLSGEAMNSCQGGAYMEHVSSYLAVHLFVEDRKDGYGPDPVSVKEAESMCNGLNGDAVYPCSRKAALFWGPTLQDTTFKSRCESISTGAPDRERSLHACGAGVGEWIRNSERWGIPETKTEAEELSPKVVDACEKAVGNDDGLLMASCVEGVVTAILPGQILSVADRGAWIDPCLELERRGFSYAAGDCRSLRQELGA